MLHARRPWLSTLAAFIFLVMLAFSTRIATAQEPAAKGGDKPAKSKTSKTQFVRLNKDSGDRAKSLDIAITTYVGKNAAGEEVQVDLVGVIHIADKAYYQQLNKEFEKYDAVLYELVAPKGVRPEKGSAGLYSPFARMLELADQIAEIDYTKKNFVHADMSGAEVAESMKKRDEHWLKIVGQAIGQGIIQASDPSASTSDAQLLANLFTAKSPALAWKRSLAPQFGDIEKSSTLFDGPNGSTILTERNKAALKVLSEQLKTSKKRFAVFYGAAHLPDMERRMIDDMKFRRGEQTWLAAWNLSNSSPAESAKPLRVSEKEFQRAALALLDDPSQAAAKDQAKKIILFTMETPQAAVVFGSEELIWFGTDSLGKNDQRDMLMAAAYMAGNVQSQLNSGVVRNDRYAGLLSMFKVYRSLQAKDKAFKIAAVDEVVKLHADDKLLKHVLDLEGKKPTRLNKEESERMKRLLGE